MSEFGSEVSGSEVSGDSGTTGDVSEVETGSEVSEGEMDDDLSHELDDSYDSYIKGKDISSFEKEKASEIDENETDTETLDSAEQEEEKVDNAENSPERIKCRNENLEGKEHPETGVPFERKQVEVNGKQYEVVVPEFESSFDAQLPENMYEATDREQFKECNSQLKNEVAKNKDLREQFDDEQLEQIENGDTPDGYTWHHDAEAGKMQLVDTETHQKTGHTGGRSIWGGGTDNR